MRIAIIGGGTMGEVFIEGLTRTGLAQPADISVGEPREERRAYLAQRYGVATAEHNPQALAPAEIVILAVKPQQLGQVAADLRGALRPEQTVVSIVAGASLATLARELRHRNLVRVMPNTPARVGAGVSVWTPLPDVPREHLEAVRDLLRALGEEVRVEDEKAVDMATALSASGPAFVFLFLEALVDAGVYIGLDREMARSLALHTVAGAVEMLRRTGQHPAQLRDMVASPGGTTIEGLLALEEAGLRAGVMHAVIAAYEKSRELGEGV